MKILVTGSSGLIGSALVSFFESNGHAVFKLVRSRSNLLSHEIAWDMSKGSISDSDLEEFDAVVHLAGENIMGRWTRAKKERIGTSRVDGTRLLCHALSQLQHPPPVLICASAIGYYGDRGDEILIEQSPKGQGFLANVCEEWEEATREASAKGIRTLNLRIGMVLSPEGGALQQMLSIFKLGLGGKIGSGKQYVSWIAIEDLIRIIDFLINQNHLAGPVNAVSPHPITNTELTNTLGKLLHRPILFSIPEFAVKLIFGDLGKEVLLASERVKPQKLEEAGFQYDYPSLEGTLKHVLREG